MAQEREVYSSFKLTGTDAVVLMYHMYKYAAKHGNMDAARSLDELIGKFTFSVRVKQPILESGLYSCNMMGEEEEFWHPRGLTFDEFVKDVAHGFKFNKQYNWLE